MQDPLQSHFVGTIIIISITFFLCAFITQNQILVQAQDDPVVPIAVEEKWAFPLFVLALITTVAAIIAIFTVKLFENNRQKRQTYEALKSILRELRENKKALTGTAHEHIVYETEGNLKDRIRINYTNAYLELESYESVLHTGLIAHTEIETQQWLTMLYSRIRSRNELLTYVDRYQDLFFLIDESDERKIRWYHKVRRYDILMTEWEYNIIDLLEGAEDSVLKEIRRLTIKIIGHQPGN